MEFVRSFASHTVVDLPKTGRLQVLCLPPETEGSATKSAIVPDARFEEISRELEANV